MMIIDNMLQNNKDYAIKKVKKFIQNLQNIKLTLKIYNGQFLL